MKHCFNVDVKVKQKMTFSWLVFLTTVDFGAKVPVIEAHNVYMLFHGISQPSDSLPDCLLIFYSAMCKMKLVSQYTFFLV